MYGVFITTKNTGSRIHRNLFQRGKQKAFPYTTGDNCHDLVLYLPNAQIKNCNAFLMFCRFTEARKSERHPLAWMPFGSGPRTCVGLRLAQLEGKMTIIRMLKKYTFVPSTTQEIPIQFEEGATILPKGGVNVSAVLRSS
jgi:hypothetical protein